MNVIVVTMMIGGMVGKTTVMITALEIVQRNVEDHGGYRCLELVRVMLPQGYP